MALQKGHRFLYNSQEKTYEKQKSTMNLLISKVYLDIEFKNYEPSKYIYENEKLVLIVRPCNGLLYVHLCIELVI